MDAVHINMKTCELKGAVVCPHTFSLQCCSCKVVIDKTTKIFTPIVKKGGNGSQKFIEAVGLRNSEILLNVAGSLSRAQSYYL